MPHDLSNLDTIIVNHAQSETERLEAEVKHLRAELEKMELEARIEQEKKRQQAGKLAEMLQGSGPMPAPGSIPGDVSPPIPAGAGVRFDIPQYGRVVGEPLIPIEVIEQVVEKEIAATLEEIARGMCRGCKGKLTTTYERTTGACWACIGGMGLEEV